MSKAISRIAKNAFRSKRLKKIQYLRWSNVVNSMLQSSATL